MAFFTVALAVIGGSAAARETADGAGADRGIDVHPASPEPDSAGWTLHVDNDLFALADRDRDYTAGVAFSLGGDSARKRAPALFRALDGFDNALALGPFAPSGHVEGHALELGLLLFTPQDLAAPEPLLDDRPYASLFYASGTRLRHDDERGVAYQTSLTIGVLGLPLAGSLHRAVHDAFGSVEPRGYDHQISAGGEPTFRYTASRYQRLAHGELGHRPYSVRLGTDASLGYVTEINSEVSVRWGRTHLAWWESPPGSSEYAGHPPVHGRHVSPGDGHGV
ncbi:MAG TPA: lipid A-modifier LpxR family protein, partial [Gammaproteobacteria bacterium]|nr:lipid A-modifier LpxR family protein [Gammaproteobacteria bacterium]